MKSKEIVVSVLILVLIIVISMWINCKIWNDGVCPNDGTKWTLLDVEKGKLSTDYIYKCEKCGKVIKMPEAMEILGFTETSNSEFYNN